MKLLFKRFCSFCVTCAPFVAFLLVVSNFFVSCSVIRTAHPRYFYKTIVVTNDVVTIVSNFVSSSSVSIPVDPSHSNLVSSTPLSPPVYNKPFRYFVLGGRRMVAMDGVHFSEGDICSSGIILRIFPDRIILHDGSRIDNSLSSDFNTGKKGKIHE